MFYYWTPGLDPTTTLNHLKEEPKNLGKPTLDPPEDSTPQPIPTALA